MDRAQLCRSGQSGLRTGQSRVSQGSRGLELKKDAPEIKEVSLPGQAGLCWGQGCGGLQQGVFFLKETEAYLHTLGVCWCNCVHTRVEARDQPRVMVLRHHPTPLVVLRWNLSLAWSLPARLVWLPG